MNRTRLCYSNKILSQPKVVNDSLKNFWNDLSTICSRSFPAKNSNSWVSLGDSMSDYTQEKAEMSKQK